MWASSTVRPAVEWTIASAAAIQSLICSVKPSTRTRSLPPKRCSSFSRADLVAAGDADDERVLAGERRVDRALEVADPPAAAGDEHEAGVRGHAERLAGVARGCAASGSRGEIGGRIHSTLPGPTSLSTSSIDSGWVTKWRSTPGCAQ